ncbi:MAG TPA: hypothetical protein VKD26_14205 [Streptosporangiaceae bacterium]|nr:hypothetical protein [Streptosporangiaceae bacterium]
MSETTTPPTPIGAAKSAGAKAQPQANGTPKAQPKAKAAPKPKEPTVSLGAKQVTMYYPWVKMPNGKVTKCEHTAWGHQSEKAAQQCARALLAQAAK